MRKKEIFKEILNVDFDFSGDVCLNSNDVKKGDIFFAIRKGNDYVKQATEKGAFAIYDIADYDKGLKVKDTIEFMQQFARKYREKLNAVVICITGSNGKTTVKDILASILENSFKTIGNFNNHIGEPFCILSCPIDAKYLILELGMSALKEIDLLSSIAKPDYSIITNIGDSHLEYLKTRENVFKAKSEIVSHTKKMVFVDGEDEYLKTLNNACKVFVSDVKILDNKTVFTFENKVFKTNLLGLHNAKNVALCLKLAKELNIDIESLDLLNIKLTDMRFQITKYNTNILINDAYNAAPKSMKSSLETLDKIYKDKDKYLVLADMLELGDESVKYHKDLKNVLDKITYKKCYLYGELMKNLDAKNCIHSMDKEFIKSELLKLENSVIFLKGSRSMKLEDLIGSGK